MKLTASFLAIAVLACGLAAPVDAQQSQSESEAAAPRDSSTKGRNSSVSGRFSLDIGGHDAGFVEKVEGEQATPAPAAPTPTIRVRAPIAAITARPSTMPRPGAIVVAPTGNDKDGDDD